MANNTKFFFFISLFTYLYFYRNIIIIILLIYVILASIYLYYFSVYFFNVILLHFYTKLVDYLICNLTYLTHVYILNIYNNNHNIYIFILIIKKEYYLKFVVNFIGSLFFMKILEDLEIYVYVWIY